jgi:hypothetical protein
MKAIAVFLFFILNTTGLFAQQSRQGKISVHLKNEYGQPLENGTASLLLAKDSSLIKIMLPDKNGLVEFEGLPAGIYFIHFSFNGYIETHSPFFTLTAADPVINSADIVLLRRNQSELKPITVNARKPFIQKLSDRIVVNVQNSIVNAGSSAMEILERSPGVNIDQNDNISLRGRQGVLIMIDGKPTAMTGNDLSNYLRGLPASAIERIDIITNPSSKYDASGNAGIIDIRMKKDQRLGMNGTFNAGYGQGVYSKANAVTTFNYRNKRLNIFGNHNYAYRIGLNHLYLDRNFFEQGIYNGGDLKDNYSKSPLGSHASRLGIDFFASERSVIGFVLNSNFSHYRRNNNNSSIVINPQKEQESTFLSLAGNNDHSRNLVANLNFKHRFDTAGTELTADADYGIYHSNSLTVNATKYFQLDGTILQPDYTLHGDQAGRLYFKTGKIDLVAPMKATARLEAGVKTSFVSSDNDARFTDVSTGIPVNDTNKTNHFLYHETNLAAYVIYKKGFKKFDFQVGLRGEQTKINTEQKIGSIKFDSSYFQLFPSSFFNYHFREDKTIGISVSRRIDRPGYSQLNPFLFLIDVTTYSTGLPGLLPQLTWSYELSYSIRNLNFTLGYSRTKDNQNIAIARFKDVFPTIPSGDNVTVQIPVNLRSMQAYSVNMSAPVRVNKWWNMISNVDLSYEKFKGSLANTQLNNGKPVADIRISNSFTLPKGWAAELNANFNSGGQYGFMVIEPQWGIGIGVQKAVLKNKGMLRFNMTDIFWTNLPKAVITYENYVEKWHAFRETRVASLGFSYRFGNSKVQAARRRTTASEEERQRAQ